MGDVSRQQTAVPVGRVACRSLVRAACLFCLLQWGLRPGWAADTWVWEPFGQIGAPTNRYFETAVWTGTKLLLWGGQDLVTDRWYSDGYRFNPGTGVWKRLSTNEAPSPRYGHTAVWTGREMIIWGGWGTDLRRDLNSGARYDPITDQWHPTSPVDAPAARTMHTAVWTGTEMIVWGGDNIHEGDQFSTGARYDPATDTWSPTSISNPPSPRWFHSAVWTGREMIVWGGTALSCHDYECHTQYREDLGRYDPVSDRWTTRIVSNAPPSRSQCSVIWDGSGMIIWGGARDLVPLDDGARFDPVGETWSPISRVGAPSARFDHAVAWTGKAMIVWGGSDEEHALNTGGRYIPTGDTWVAGSTNAAPPTLSAVQAVWSGEALLTFTDGLRRYYRPGLYANDRLPDDWQERYFGPDNPQALADADPDGDGLNNWEEFVAGTDPTLASSALQFRCERVVGKTNKIRLTFSPRWENRLYTVLRSTNLTSGPYDPVNGLRTNDQAETRSIIVTNAGRGVKWFRLKVDLP